MTNTGRLAVDTAQPVRRGGVGYWSFVVLMLALTALFVGLGIWQVERLQWKEALIAEVADRPKLPPVPIPPVADWGSVDPEALDYRQLQATGTFAPNETIRIFTALSEPHGQYRGPGYWQVTPLHLAGGGTLFVNRGFVPQDKPATRVSPPPTGKVTVTGIGRHSEETNWLTPGPDTRNRVDWVRTIDRLAAFAGAGEGPFFPMSIDLPAGPPGALPQAGETAVEFPNSHLGYAMTWFGFAIITPVLLVAWMRRPRRPRPPRA